jgi:hypothetical protein
MRNAFSHCNGSSAFSSREAINPTKVIICDEEYLMGFSGLVIVSDCCRGNRCIVAPFAAVA